MIEGNGSYVETWKAMEKLVENGLTKSIGVSNFNKRQIEDILDVATIKPVNNQVRIIVDKINIFNQIILNSYTIIQYCMIDIIYKL